MLDFILRFAFVLAVGAIIAAYAKHLRDSPPIAPPCADEPLLASDDAEPAD